MKSRLTVLLNETDVAKGTIIHYFPFSKSTHPEGKNRRIQWIKFVRVKRGPENGKEWIPTRNSGICSEYFRLYKAMAVSVHKS